MNEPYYIIDKKSGIKFIKYRRGCCKDIFYGKAVVTRTMKENNLYDTHNIVPCIDYKPVMVERINLMSGEKYMEDINTPHYCSPAFESYWSM